MTTNPTVGKSVRELLIDKAILTISNIKFEEGKLDSINSNLRDMFGDFSPVLSLATDNIQNNLVDILDLILGEKLASYYLYECGGQGRITEKDGTEWPITSLDELKTYSKHLMETYP